MFLLNGLRLGQFLKQLIILEKLFTDGLCLWLFDFILNLLRILQNFLYLLFGFWLLKLHHSAFLDLDGLAGFVAIVSLTTMHFLYDILTAFYSTKYNMLSIKMGCFTEGNKELGPICISASVGA